MMWFEDEASFYQNATPAKTWAPCGRRQPRAHGRARSNTVWRLAASLDPVNGRLTYGQYRRIDAPAIGQFYAQTCAAVPDARRIYLVMDNWPVHHHPKALAAITGDPRIQPLWLPTYAPWLNPTEKVWKWLRQRYGHMHNASEDFNAYGEGLLRSLGLAASDPAALLRYTGTGKLKLYT